MPWIINKYFFSGELPLLNKTQELWCLMDLNISTCIVFNSRSLSFAYLKGHLQFQTITIFDEVTVSQVECINNLNLGSMYVLQSFQVSGVDFLLVLPET